MRAVVAALRRYARADANVLITGETGTGKDLAARTLHQLGRRRGHPFIVIDCPGLATSLLEAELFGHERWRIHGRDDGAAKPLRAGRRRYRLSRSRGRAVARRPGQAAAPRRAETGRAARLDRRGPDTRPRHCVGGRRNRGGGSRRPLPHGPVSPLARAADQDSAAASASAGDVPVLARRLMTELTNAAGQRGALAISRDAMAILTAYDWPGNVRELRHVLERAVTASDANVIDGRRPCRRRSVTGTACRRTDQRAAHAR